MKIKNPVLRGFNPDPSILRVGDMYYIANSTFEWFPGVRLHSSKDLVHWKMLPPILNSKKLIDMTGDPSSGGVWAPDLSYADGKFWLVFSDVKTVNGPFKDCINYLTTANNIEGPWSKPIKLDATGFDASLFHDTDGKKYLVQQTWDQREYKNTFNGITLTEFDPLSQRLLPQTRKVIYRGTDVKVLEGPHVYKINGYYYLFAAQGGTSWSHQEIVARSKSLVLGTFITEPDGPFITNFDTPDFELQKQGHGSLVNTLDGEWYYASLCSRPWHHKNESAWDPRGWCTLGRETSIQKVEWDSDGWPRVVGGHGGLISVPGPQADKKSLTSKPNNSRHDEFLSSKLDSDWQTLRQPFTKKLGYIKNKKLVLKGNQSLSSLFDVSLLASRWQAFNFDATTKIKYEPYSYQQMAGLVNFYNDKHYSWVFITYNEVTKHKVIEVAQNNNNIYTSFLKDNAVEIPNEIKEVWLKTCIRKDYYYYMYSFDGKDWNRISIDLDAAILSDDYVMQTSGGFFTGAMVGLASVDCTGFELPAEFDYFDYKELDENLL
ncbi:glycoside hydrolase family 43 protein [Limosilactobacillus albertensis]|uniref:Glycoside hydrolase family 43 protein n=1 Tax=Limosilactobacillus albertensis TaxID=2759752 RepID=A0A839H250_9LACO|nr:glycoside hydrolase family 43 protein [Limosilactobacillus albertensis]MBB1123971.1 glycoside hydrolase family 43 protein [Limosilactobacillus albertensis]MCD7121656.1 glycoside hydrolase family 43 protein [Limosilactobacillus albertensis]